MVVPAVRVGSPARSRRHLRSRGVIGERERRGGTGVAGSVGAGPAERRVRSVRARVDLRRGAGVDPRRCVRAVERDPDRLVVPAVRIRLAGRSAERLRRRAVVADGKRADARVPGMVDAGTGDRGVLRVGAGVGLRRDAGIDPGGCVGAGEADRELVVVPAVRVRVARRGRGHDRARLVVLEAEARARTRVPRPVTARAAKPRRSASRGPSSSPACRNRSPRSRPPR